MQISKLEQLHKLIGGTPLIKINYEYLGKKRSIYGKAEWYNLTGSIKDRVALNIIQNAYKTNALKKGQPIVETSSGNTGISFSAIGTYLGHPVTIVMPDYMSDERKKLIKSFGAKLELVKACEGGFLLCLEKAKKIANKQKAFMPLQFENEVNTSTHYNYTSKEIYTQLKTINKKPKAVILGVGTGGTLMGIGKRVKESNGKVFALEPESSPTLRYGKKMGSHKIQGISDEFIPPILDKNYLDEIIDVSDIDSMLMSKKLGEKLGLGVGISSGANFLGAVLANQQFEQSDVVITVFADDNKKYLSLLNENLKQKPNFLSPKIELINYEVISV